ncbi:hypothetical protein GPL15_10995 [Clostridium sp. MCC353]|uniref:uroporphyrinogen decarboxylase family protein n=1 Tax=Clostridium sp. MCC353 TaxID=2592646 RepID=UPI001C0173FE|nr:uroporphyrinogen decarboxylase family protein [Clostridium sp. MCC353]MBT9777027.1 hypothetical protein [Clostridium sp. MCC353]
MTPKERMEAALNLRRPDQVPTFELEFQLEEELYGRKFITQDIRPENLGKLSKAQRQGRMYELAEYMIQVYTDLEYSVIPAYGPHRKKLTEDGDLPDETRWLHRYLFEMAEGKMMLGFEGDGTFAIPSGEDMYEFSYALADDPDGMKKLAGMKAEAAVERNKKLRQTGVEVLMLCSDYCFNSGPFFSPAMFEEFVQPYLGRIIEEAKKEGFYVIKHTDGNILPILDQIVECRPHAIHSLDPMAGIDMADIREKAGDKVCLCGNVICSGLQSGTEQELIDSAVYCLTEGKKAPGYVYTTSNCPFSGALPERYRTVQKVWRELRVY